MLILIILNLGTQYVVIELPIEIRLSVMGINTYCVPKII